jgi:hypothetical protein
MPSGCGRFPHNHQALGARLDSALCGPRWICRPAAENGSLACVGKHLRHPLAGQLPPPVQHGPVHLALRGDLRQGLLPTQHLKHRLCLEPCVIMLSHPVPDCLAAPPAPDQFYGASLYRLDDAETGAGLTQVFLDATNREDRERGSVCFQAATDAGEPVDRCLLWGRPASPACFGAWRQRSGTGGRRAAGVTAMCPSPSCDGESGWPWRCPRRPPPSSPVGAMFYGSCRYEWFPRSIAPGSFRTLHPTCLQCWWPGLPSRPHRDRCAVRQNMYSRGVFGLVCSFYPHVLHT